MRPRRHRDPRRQVQLTPVIYPGMLLYPWGVRVGDYGPLAPIRVYGPSRPGALSAGDAIFHPETMIHPELPAPGTADLVGSILAGYAYHLNFMPLDAHDGPGRARPGNRHPPPGQDQGHPAAHGSWSG
jgi:hypothetical protein